MTHLGTVCMLVSSVKTKDCVFYLLLEKREEADDIVNAIIRDQASGFWMHLSLTELRLKFGGNFLQLFFPSIGKDKL